MITAKEVYQAQKTLDSAEFNLYHLSEDLHAEASRSGSSLMDVEASIKRHPGVEALNGEISQLKTTIEDGQRALGGKVYRIPAENVSTFEKKVDKINRKAAKLGCDLVKITNQETEEEVKKSQGQETLYVWHYMILAGSTPMVPGYRFLAALDHTVQAQEGDPVIIKRVPGTDEDIDLNEYRTANAQCDHCHQLRARNTTYILQEDATGDFFKVGSTCLRDFTGANDPEKVASYMEYLIEFDEQSTEMGEDYSSSGRNVRSTIEYLTHVAACIRHDGWSARSSSGYATADQAWSNIANYGKNSEKGIPMYVTIQDEDGKIAEAAIKWAQGLNDRNEFEGNLKVMAGLEYMPVKGDGIVAYIVQGYVKDETKRVEREAEEARKAHAAATAEPITAGRQVLSGTITKVYEKNDPQWGLTWKMTILEDRGFSVNGSIPKDLFAHYNHTENRTEGKDAEVGDHVTFTATVKPKEGDDTYGWYTRPTKAKIDEKVTA